MKKQIKRKMKRMRKRAPTVSLNLTVVVVMIIIVLGAVYALSELEFPQYNIYNDDDDDTTTTETTTPIITPTTTTPEDPDLPPGTWYHFEVMFSWADWVAPIDYRDIWVGVSTLGFVGIDDYTFDRIDVNTWYEFDTFRVEEGAQGYISMMSMIDPIDMTFSYEAELDYNLAEAGPFSGQFPFYDTSAPMAAGPAGHIMYSWVLL